MIAVVAAFALLEGVMILVANNLVIQEAEAGCERGADSDTTPTQCIRIAFEATHAVGIDRTECSLDGQPLTSCVIPVVYDRLGRDDNEFTVRAIDDACNVEEDEFT